MAASVGLRQAEVMEKIASYGRKNGFSTDEINFAIKVAFIESSLGLLNSNGISGNTSQGLFQYNDDAWDRSGLGGDRTKDDDQIAAFFNDVRRYKVRYSSLPPERKADVSLFQYMYIKHHDGSDYHEDFKKAPGKALYDNCTFAPPPGYTIRDITTVTLDV
jgi:hypothetical protein